ncbi:hypothetical protein V6D40_07050 [Corynebacterium sp. Q4381]|uniref:hypothetical protein n=1 Tax=Corynebacterium sp. Marseille-Q4381 TaxID=3121597 RepID=UPI002FE5C412
MRAVIVALAVACLTGPPRPLGRIEARSGETASFNPAWIPVAVGAVALTAFATGRAGVVVAAACAGACAVHTVAARRAARADRARAAAAAEFIGHLAEGVSAGATLAGAAARATERLPESAPATLRRDCLVFAAAAQRGDAPPEVATPELQRVTALWALSTTRGVPVAGLLATARDEIDHQLRHRAATTAALSGPKTTAVVLSLLPLAGIGMGAAMGAQPVALLTSPGIGSVLLVAGTALVSAGVVTSGEIIRRAAA